MINQFYIILFGLLGSVTYKLLNYKVSGTRNSESPKKFSFSYWINDRGNWNDLLLGAILFVILAVYKEDIFKIYPEFWLVKSMAPFSNSWLLYFILGLLMTFIIKIVRNLTWLISNISNSSFKNK